MAIFILLWWQILLFARIKSLPNLTKNASFQDTVSVHRPGFYAHRFLDFMADKVFKKIPSRKIFFIIFSKTLFIYHFISSHFFRKCKPAFQKLFYLTIIKNRESLIIIKLRLLFWINKQILQLGVKVLNSFLIYAHVPFHEIFNIHELFIYYTCLYGTKPSSIYSCFIRLLLLLHSGFRSWLVVYFRFWSKNLYFSHFFMKQQFFGNKKLKKLSDVEFKDKH